MKKVLVVDDSPVISSLLRMRLESEGFTVDSVGDGMQLLSYMKEEVAPDAVILDLFIPELSGLEALDTVANKWERTAIFVYSAQASWRHAVSRHPGVAGFFVKNEDMKEIVRAIKEKLGVKPSGRRSPG